VAAVGHVSVTLNLQIFLEGHDYTFESVRDVRAMAKELHTFLKNECFLNPQEDDRPYETSRVHLLIASAGGIFGLYDLRSVQEYTRFYAFGSGDNYALGAMHALFDGDCGALEISRAGVLAACEFDDSCGEPIEVETIQCR
jgi:ATP-dependent HslUV protease subunit HslV